VIPTLIRRFHEAKVAKASSVAIWGTGTPRREFLYVDDMAAASLHVMQLPKSLYDEHTQPTLSHINVGSSSDVTVAELAHHIARTVGYTDQITFDANKPDGAPRKWMDSECLHALGWKPRIDLQQGLAIAYQDFVSHHE